MSAHPPAVQAEFDPAELRYGDDGLVPVVVQDVASGAVLMVAWADRAAVERTLATGEACFWSRSRGRPWRKGETSGNVLSVVAVRADCDRDALLLRADPAGPTCHTGARSCFEAAAGEVSAPRLELGWLWDVVEERRDAPPEESYTARLLAAGIERVARKVGEEATETVIAALRSPRSELAGETADLLYHLLVLLSAAGVEPGEVAGELRRRHARERTPESSKPEDPRP